MGSGAWRIGRHAKSLAPIPVESNWRRASICSNLNSWTKQRCTYCPQHERKFSTTISTRPMNDMALIGEVLWTARSACRSVIDCVKFRVVSTCTRLTVLRPPFPSCRSWFWGESFLAEITSWSVCQNCKIVLPLHFKREDALSASVVHATFAIPVSGAAHPQCFRGFCWTLVLWRLFVGRLCFGGSGWFVRVCVPWCSKDVLPILGSQSSSDLDRAVSSVLR